MKLCSPICSVQMMCAVFFGIAALSVTGCRKQPAVPRVEEGQAVADRFLELIRTGKASEAWEATSAEFKSDQGRETFVASTRKHPFLTKPTVFETTETITGPLGPRAVYVYHSADNKQRVRLAVARVGENWCVDVMNVE